MHACHFTKIRFIQKKPQPYGNRSKQTHKCVLWTNRLLQYSNTFCFGVIVMFTTLLYKFRVYRVSLIVQPCLQQDSHMQQRSDFGQQQPNFGQQQPYDFKYCLNLVQQQPLSGTPLITVAGCSQFLWQQGQTFLLIVLMASRTGLSRMMVTIGVVNAVIMANTRTM